MACLASNGKIIEILDLSFKKYVIPSFMLCNTYTVHKISHSFSTINLPALYTT